MTVKELFESVGFDAIVKALRNTHRNDKSIGNLARYKEAFDILCNTGFEGEGGEVTFDVTPRGHWFDEDNLPLLACNVEGDFWENTIGKTVVKPEDNPFTDAELAGAILWGMTFYGFTRHDRWSSFEEFCFNYGERVECLERKQYLPYIRDKHVIRNLKSERVRSTGVAFSMEVWDGIDYRLKHQNRAKRKRFYRMEKRIAHLKRLYRRQHLIGTITIQTGMTDSGLASRIMNAKTIFETWRDSHIKGKADDRVEYLSDLITNYPPTFREICEGCDEIVVIAYTSTEKPLTETEEQALKKIICLATTNRRTKWLFAKGIDDETKGDISLRIIGIVQ